MTSKIKSPLIEREFLKAAPPTDVLKYLDHVAECLKEKEEGLPDETLEALLERQDRLIDISLARIAHHQSSLYNDDPVDYLEIIVERHLDDPDVLTACLSNKVDLGWLQPSSWLARRLDLILRDGTTEQLSALFSNPILPTSITEDALNREQAFAAISDERYISILWHLLKNPQIRTAPEDEFDYDWSQHRIIQATWGLLLKLEPTRASADVLADRIKDFQEVETPNYSKSKPSGSKSASTEHWTDDTKAFLKDVFERWSTPSSWKDEIYDPWGQIRQFTVRKTGDVKLGHLEKEILSPNDGYRNRGFFSALTGYHYEQLLTRFDYFLSTYGRSFLEGLIINDNTFLRSNTHLSKIARAIRQHEEKPSAMPFETLGWGFEKRAEELSRGPRSHLYITSADDFEADDESSEGEESANLADEVKRIREKLFNTDQDSLEQRLDSLFDLMSALAEKIDIVLSREKQTKAAPESTNHQEHSKSASISKWGYIFLGGLVGYFSRR
jgi:hypothetical protein